MELVETVLALEEQVKRLEGQVKALQQAQKLASTVKPVQTPAIDSSALKQQLRGEFATEINKLRIEITQLKASQSQPTPPVATIKSAKFIPIPTYVLASIVACALLVIWSLWPKSSASTPPVVTDAAVVASTTPAPQGKRASKLPSQRVKKPIRISRRETALERELRKAKQKNARLAAEAEKLGLKVPD